MKNILDKIKNRKAVISAVSLVLFVGIVFWAVNSPAVVGASASDRQLPIYCVQREDKTSHCHSMRRGAMRTLKSLLIYSISIKFMRHFLSWVSGWINTPSL